MKGSGALVTHLALLSAVSFGGFPSVLPDVHNFVVSTNGWLSDQDFANTFAVVQAIPGPNMILMMGVIGWKVGGLPVAMASSLATFAPACTIAFVVYRWWQRFRHSAWQDVVRRGLVPVTIGLVIGGGYVMALASDTGWLSATLTVAAAALLLLTRLNPLWLIAGGGVLGGLGLL